MHRLAGCPRPDHVAFTANSTMALNMAICGLLSPEDHAISTDLEHNSVLRPFRRPPAPQKAQKTAPACNSLPRNC